MEPLLSNTSIDPLIYTSTEIPGVYGIPFWLCWVIIGVLLLVSGLFSASENAFSNCNKYHFKVLANQGHKTAKVIVYLTEKFESTLVSVLVGNNIVQTLMSFISAILFYNICDYYGLGDSIEGILSTVVMAFLVYIVSDTCPKILSKAIPNKMCYILAWPDFIVGIILFPVIIIFRGILHLVHKLFKIDDSSILTKEDFIETADEAVSEDEVTNKEEQLFEPDEIRMLDRAFIFDQISVKQVLTPKDRIVSFSIDDLYVSKLNELIMNSSFSRFPIYEDSKDNIIGILSINTYFKEYSKDPHFDVRSILLPPVFFDENAKVDDIFDTLNKEKLHIGLVKNPNGKLIGMVTMEDILDELVGETANKHFYTSTDIKKASLAFQEKTK